LIVAAALVVADLMVFLLIAEDLLDGGGLISRDQAVLTWFVEHRSHWLIRAAEVVSTVGEFVSVAMMAIVLGIWLWRRRWRPWIAAAPLLALVLASLAATAAKGFFNRDRPPVSLRATTASLAAFPSGHATDAAAFFLAASLTLAITVAHRRSTKVVFIAAGLFLATLVGLSRLILGVHWLSDVVAGWSLGSAVAIVVVVASWYMSTRSDATKTTRWRRPT
jgi:membrane-associated phospholipid phosphatase